MPAIPLIIMGISAASSAYAASKQSAAASQQADFQNQMAQGQAGIAKNLSNFAGNQISSSQPAVDRATQYYGSILSGNRSAVGAQMAQPLAQMSDMYGGAKTAIANSTAPGAQRDLALSRLVQQGVGQAGLMPMQIQQSAAGNLNAIGQAGLNRATSAYGGAANAMGGATNTSNSAFGMQQAAIAPWQQFGYTQMQQWAPYLMQYNKKTQDSPWGGTNPTASKPSGVPNLPYTNNAFLGWSN